MLLIVATRSSGPPASNKIIKEMPVSVASGTLYIMIINLCNWNYPGSRGPYAAYGLRA
jgi:hypothetical protein